MGSLPKDFKSFASADFAILAYLCIDIQFLCDAKDFKSLASAGFAILAFGMNFIKNYSKRRGECQAEIVPAAQGRKNLLIVQNKNKICAQEVAVAVKESKFYRNSINFYLRYLTGRRALL